MLEGGRQHHRRIEACSSAIFEHLPRSPHLLTVQISPARRWQHVPDVAGVHRFGDRLNDLIDSFRTGLVSLHPIAAGRGLKTLSRPSGEFGHRWMIRHDERSQHLKTERGRNGQPLIRREQLNVECGRRQLLVALEQMKLEPSRSLFFNAKHRRRIEPEVELPQHRFPPRFEIEQPLDRRSDRPECVMQADHEPRAANQRGHSGNRHAVHNRNPVVRERVAQHRNCDNVNRRSV